MKAGNRRVPRFSALQRRGPAVFREGVERGLPDGVRPVLDGVCLLRRERPVPLFGKITVTFDPSLPFRKWSPVPEETWACEGMGRAWVKDKPLRIEFGTAALEPDRFVDRAVPAVRVDSVVTAGGRDLTGRPRGRE